MPSASHRSQGLLQLAHDPSGVLQRRVCGRLRHPAADAPERRSGGRVKEAGHQLGTAERRERVQVEEEDELQTADKTEDTFIRLNPPPPPRSDDRRKIKSLSNHGQNRPVWPIRHTARVHVKVTSVSSFGGSAVSWVMDVSALPCSIPKSVFERDTELLLHCSLLDSGPRKGEQIRCLTGEDFMKKKEWTVSSEIKKQFHLTHYPHFSSSL